MMLRRTVLPLAAGIALGLSLSVGTLALVGQGDNALRLTSAPLVLAQAEPSQAPAETGYLVRTVDNEVCVFQGEELMLRTGVMASTLPQQDREALEVGLPAADQAALTALLEDLSS